MTSPLDSESGRALLRASRIVVIALASGPLLFLMVVLFLRFTSEEPDTYGPGGHLITYVSLAFASMALMMRAVIPGAVAAHGRRQIAGGTFRPGGGASGKAWAEVLANGGARAKLLAVFQSTTIIGAAVVESAALLGCVAYFMEGWWPAVVVAVVFTLMIPVLHFPTRHGAENWIADQEKLLREES